jgi:hypothetical protein
MKITQYFKFANLSIFAAASPTRQSPSLNRIEIESTVCPGVSKILPSIGIPIFQSSVSPSIKILQSCSIYGLNFRLFDL